VEQGIAEILG